MAVARVPLRLRLCQRPFTPFRLATTTAPRVRRPAASPKDPERTRRSINPDDRAYYKPDGTLFTTQTNVDFLLEYDISHDNGITSPLGDRHVSKLSSQMNVKVDFCARHLLNPQHLSYFHPGGHPMAAATRAAYARRAREQPLWIWVTTMGQAPAVVRTITQRRLKKAVFTALEQIGYGPSGQGLGKLKTLHGTLVITMYNPVKAANSSAEVFGKTVADALHRRNMSSGF